MVQRPPVATPSARWIAPRVPLASCVRAYFTRSTLGCPLLPPAQRVNRFPAHAYCSLTWFIQGEPELVEPASDAWAGRVLARELFGGPRSEPVVAYHSGPMRGFTLLLYPQALHALTGLDISDHVDRFTALADVFDASWQALSQQVLAAADDDARVALIERFLEPRWHAARANGETRTHAVADWVRALSAQAAAVGWGQSARNMERRIKAWAGQPLRRLRRLNRVEQSFFEARARMRAGTYSWADIAAWGGYADQAHLCRDMREITGHSPSELARKVEEDDESYWAYRIWS
jgi:AraC-like DNA-binding protein